MTARVKDYDIDDFVQNSPPEVTTELADGYPAVQRLDAEDERQSPPDGQECGRRRRCPRHRCLGQVAALLQREERQPQLAERVHNIKRVMSYGDVLPRMEKWEASLKEHEKDTQKEVADVTKANCLRNMVPNELYSDLTKMSHIVLYDDVKRYIIEQVSLRQSTEKKTVKGNGDTASGQTVPVPMDTSLRGCGIPAS